MSAEWKNLERVYSVPRSPLGSKFRSGPSRHENQTLKTARRTNTVRTVILIVSGILGCMGGLFLGGLVAALIASATCDGAQCGFFAGMWALVGAFFGGPVCAGLAMFVADMFLRKERDCEITRDLRGQSRLGSASRR